MMEVNIKEVQDLFERKEEISFFIVSNYFLEHYVSFDFEEKLLKELSRING